MSRKSDYITEARRYNKQVWDGISALKEMQREWSALDYGGTNPLGAGVGDNSGIAGADVGSVVFATTDAFLTLLATGHATNMGKLL